jgi:hypothetical protein
LKTNPMLATEFLLEKRQSVKEDEA